MIRETAKGGNQLARRKKTRAAARKIKDKWKAKKWYSIIAPEMFESVRIGETLTDDPDKLIDRVTEVTLQDLTGDFSKMHIKLKFKIVRVSGFNAHTKFIGHDMTSDYIRRQTRRKRSKMDGNVVVETKDGYRVRVKPLAIAERRIQASQQRLLRKRMHGMIEEAASDNFFRELIKEIISGGLPAQIFKKCKPIYPLKRVEIYKTHMLGKVPSEYDVPPEEEGEGEAGEEGAVSEEEAKKLQGVVEAFTAIEGIDEEIANLLYEHGYHDLDALELATIADLAEIEGISEELAEGVRDHFL